MMFNGIKIGASKLLRKKGKIIISTAMFFMCPASLEAGHKIDWIGIGFPINFIFSPENKPLIISLGNDFLPNRRSDYFFTSETAASSLSASNRERALAIRDNAWLSFLIVILFSRR